MRFYSKEKVAISNCKTRNKFEDFCDGWKEQREIRMKHPFPYFLVNGEYLNSYPLHYQVKPKSTTLHMPDTDINEIILVH